MRPGEIIGEQLGEEEFAIRVLPPRAGARPITLSVGPAPRRFQPTRRRRGRSRNGWEYAPEPSARTLYWVVAGSLSEDRDEGEHISRHYDFGIAIRSALRRAKRLAATPRRKP